MNARQLNSNLAIHRIRETGLLGDCCFGSEELLEGHFCLRPPNGFNVTNWCCVHQAALDTRLS